METRFKTIRLNYQEKLKDKNHKAKFTQGDLSKKFAEMKFYISREKITKLETGHSEVTISKEILLAYSKFFNVSSDWLLGLSNTQFLTGDIHNASKVTNLSEEALRKIKSYPVKSQNILNRIIENGSIEHIIKSIYTYIPDGFDATNKNITENIGYEFYRFLATRELQIFLDEVISDKRIFSLLYKEYEEDVLKKFAELFYEDNPESYNELLKVGKRHGLDFPKKGKSK